MNWKSSYTAATRRGRLLWLGVETWNIFSLSDTPSQVQITPDVKVSGYWVGPLRFQLYRWGHQCNRLIISFYISVIWIEICRCLVQTTETCIYIYINKDGKPSTKVHSMFGTKDSGPYVMRKFYYRDRCKSNNKSMATFDWFENKRDLRPWKS